MIKLAATILTAALLSSCLTGCFWFINDGAFAVGSTDVSDLVNEASTRSARGVLRLNVTFGSGIWDDGDTYIGSAVIVDYDATNYYALTCAHCLTRDEGFLYRKIHAIDAFGNEYTASPVVIDEAIDLAYISFRAEYTLDELEIIDLSDGTLEVGDTVISIGSPHGLSQVVTVGEFIGYHETALVDFLTINHSAIIGGGSSGGALLNADLELVGINFAGLDDEEYSNGYAIPIEKVLEFLEQNELS